MSGKILKCFWCGKRDREDKIEIIKGKQKRRYHSEKCYDEYLKDQEYKKREKEELDELIETIKKVHDIKAIPNQFYPFIQDLRNGNEFFGRIGQKRNKEGYRYSVIAETYLKCQSNIDWAKANVNFDNTFGMLKYTLAIIKKNIDKVNEEIERKEHNREVKKTIEDQAINIFKHTIKHPTKYRKSKSRVDASNFLD